LDQPRAQLKPLQIQTTATENGIYVVTAVGSSSTEDSDTALFSVEADGESLREASSGMRQEDESAALQARAEARALLYKASEFDLEEALAPLYAYALDSGLHEQLDSEAFFTIIHKPFEGTAEI
jgi:hypothetical protein